MKSIMNRVFERREVLRDFVVSGFWSPKMMDSLESLLGLLDAAYKETKNEKFRQLYTGLPRIEHPRCRCVVAYDTLYGVSTTPKCPQCNRRMTVKVNTYTGGEFWGCQSWPACYGTRDMDDPTRDRGVKIKHKHCGCCGNGGCCKCDEGIT
jgi:hypothetical protein